MAGAPSLHAQPTPPKADDTVIDGLPFALPPFDSSSVSRARSFLFHTPAELDAARTRARDNPSDRAILDRHVAAAEKHLALAPAPLDPSWWEIARGKKWEDTYPEVFLHTYIEPARIARPASDLALAGALTGDARFTDKARALLLLLEPYSFEFDHYDVGMNYSVWGVDALRAYDLLFDRLAAAERARLDAFFTRMVRAVLRNDVFWIRHRIGGGINNHLAWHKLTAGLLGLFYGRPEMADYAMRGPRGILPLLEDGLLDDGLWCESSLVYQFTAIDPMAILADAQRRAGDNACLFDAVGANGRTLRQPFEAMFGVLAPDGTIPPIGDAYGRRKPLWVDPIYETVWGAWRDPRVAWLLRRNPERPLRALFVPPLPDDPPPPPAATRLFPEHAYAFLRAPAGPAYWTDPAARCAFLTYDRSGVHANADKLGLMLFGQGRMLLSDVEGRATVPHAFSASIQRELNRGALAQNTVMIDGRDQRHPPDRLTLVEFRDLPDEPRVTAADDRGLLYEGVRQMRSVSLAPGYVLDVFQVDAGAAARQIDWVMHAMDEQARMEDAPAAEPFPLPAEGAWRWLREGRSFRPAGDLALAWTDGEARLRLRMADPGAERVILCGFPATDEAETKSIPMAIVRVRGTKAVFAAVWLIGDAPAEASIAALPPREDALEFEVRAGGRTRRHLVPKLSR